MFGGSALALRAALPGRLRRSVAAGDGPVASQSGVWTGAAAGSPERLPGPSGWLPYRLEPVRRCRDLCRGGGCPAAVGG